MSESLWLHVWPVISLAGLAFFSSLAITGFMVFAGMGDTPNSRSSHSRVTPSCGGVGFVAAFGICGIALALIFPSILYAMPTSFAKILSLIFALGALGLCDDIFEFSPRLKFILMILISALGVHCVGYPTRLPWGDGAIALPPLIGFWGAVLWVFVLINAVNFIDGANGLMANTLIIPCLALGFIGLSAGSVIAAFLCGVLMFALLGFLPYNMRKYAAIFCGDTGALVAGFAFALAGLASVRADSSGSLLYFAPLLILPILSDVLLTLLWRAKRRKNLMQPHKEHLFARLIISGLSHMQIAWIYGLVSLVCANLAVYGIQSGLIRSPLYVGGLSVIFTVIYFGVGAHLAKRNVARLKSANPINNEVR
jgi:UDP-N-acetylmuramyl pentapeptide phosphotransferase/UDP-N-acetylglucosamine-1-phosphate transferase